MNNDSEGNENLIKEIQLKTRYNLEKLAEFYKIKLGLEVVQPNDRKEIIILSGKSAIIFGNDSDSNGLQNGDPPFYHFAFNIPENKIKSAHTWAANRLTLLKPDPDNYSTLHDPDYPDEIIHFKAWNAHSVFFKDPAGNILEFIARHNLNNAGKGEFSERDIKYISEIGLVVENVIGTTEILKARFGVDEYQQPTEQFAALGDENGLILLIKKGRQWGPDSGRRAAIYPVTLRINKEISQHAVYSDEPYNIISNSS